ncbi:MAG: hypothetical protein QXT26_01250 [Thermoproteota archaeon]
MISKINVWDRIRIRPPICYLPPMWEIIVSNRIDPVQAGKTLPLFDPDPEPILMEKYFKARIELVKTLVREGKLDSRIGEAAIQHFETHLKELEPLRK